MSIAKYQRPEIVARIADDLRAMEIAAARERGEGPEWADTPSAIRSREREAHRFAAEQTGGRLDEYGRLLA